MYRFFLFLNQIRTDGGFRRALNPIQSGLVIWARIGSRTFSTETEFREYHNAFWGSVTASFSKRVDVRRYIYAILFR